MADTRLPGVEQLRHLRIEETTGQHYLLLAFIPCCMCDGDGWSVTQTNLCCSSPPAFLSGSQPVSQERRGACLCDPLAPVHPLM
jgi:hypothetical protein